MLKLVERYLTVGGEAPIAGEPVYIIRFSGCNLNCLYCDTKYNWEENESLSTEELIKAIKEQTSLYSGLKILITGGEPLLGERQEKLLSVIRKIPETEFFIETNGSIPVYKSTPSNCHFIADWKSPSSGEGESFFHDNLSRFSESRDCMKFVVSREDLPWLEERVREIKKMLPDLPLYVSPQWEALEFQELAEFIISRKLNLNLSLQIHKIIWPPELRGV